MDAFRALVIRRDEATKQQSVGFETLGEDALMPGDEDLNAMIARLERELNPPAPAPVSAFEMETPAEPEAAPEAAAASPFAPEHVEEELSPCPGIAAQVGLPSRLGRRSGQAADIRNELLDLLWLESITHFLHGRLGHTILDDVGDVVIGAAVNPAVVGQVGSLAAATGTAVTAAA